MPALREEQELDSPAAGDCHSPGLLSAATHLSAEPGFGGRCQSGHPSLPTPAGSLVPPGRAAAGKSVVFGLLERDGCVYTKVVESVSSEELMQRIQSKTLKGPVCFTEAFRGYQSLKRYGNPHTVNHTNSLVDRRNKNHFNGIEGFWSSAKHI